jgi:Flp pilus assembly protein TadB
MLSPAVMISSCGLLLLALTPKLSRVIDRIRILNQEKLSIAKRQTLDDTDRYRLQSLQDQTEMLVYRARLLKNSNGLTLLAILFFVITSVLIGITYILNTDVVIIALVAFLSGMLLFLIGVGFAYWEIHTSHGTIIEEIETSKEMIHTLLQKFDAKSSPV